jgi:alcohol dehydrogenase class IV
MLSYNKKFYLPTKVVFGAGSLKELSNIVSSNDHVFLVTDRGIEKAGIAKPIEELIRSIGAKVSIFNRAEPNPTARLALEALAELKDALATKVIAIGGGSSLDLGKVIAALATNSGSLEDYQWNGRDFENEALPFIAIPTTAGTGSEVTKVAVIASRNVKKGVNSDKLFPKVAIIDPELMKGLPPSLTASTGMDALSHAIEAYVGLNSNPFTDALAIEAVRLISRSLCRACQCESDIKAREDMALASTLAGIAMDQGGLGIVHSMAGPLCGIFHLPHGEANAVLLKYGMHFNLKAASKKFSLLASALGCDTNGLSLEEAGAAAVDAVSKLVEQTGLKVNLQAYGLQESHADIVAEQTEKMFLIKNNPWHPSKEECKQLYLEVLKGEILR